jgi:hypothetical protein
MLERDELLGWEGFFPGWLFVNRAEAELRNIKSHVEKRTELDHATLGLNHQELRYHWFGTKKQFS